MGFKLDIIHKLVDSNMAIDIKDLGEEGEESIIHWLKNFNNVGKYSLFPFYNSLTNI